MLKVDASSSGDELAVLEQDPAGRMVAAGSVNLFGGNTVSTIGAIRFDAATGALDPGFGNQSPGLAVATYAGGRMQASGIAFGVDGGYYIAGTASDSFGPATRSVLSRIDSAGQPVTSFGNGGSIGTMPPWDYGVADEGFAGVTLSGDRVNAIGNRVLPADFAGNLRRSFALNRAFDASLGAAQGEQMGQALNMIGAVAVKSAMLPDGRALLVGSYGDSARVTRLLPDGSLDAGFRDAGHFDFQVEATPTAGSAIAIDAAGNMLVASLVTRTEPWGAVTRRWSVTRWTAEGSEDTSFAGGNAYVGYNYSRASLAGVALQADGKAIVGFVGDGTLFVTRLNADGSTDSSFAGGMATWNLGGENASAAALALHADGGVLVAVNEPHQFAAGVTRPSVLRFTASGDIDFNWRGQDVFGLFGQNTLIVSAMTSQPDGKVLLAGTGVDGQLQPFVLRLGTDGYPDMGFGANGWVIDAGSVGSFTAVGLAGSNRVVAGGDLATGYPFAIALSASGSLDTAYGSGGRAVASVRSADWIASLIDSMGTVRLMGYDTTAAGEDQLLFVQFQGGEAADTEPDFIQIAEVTNAPLNALVVSAPITISGINVAVPFAVEGGEYSIGCTGSFTSQAGTISDGQTLCIRVMSAATESTWASAWLVVGSQRVAFGVKTGDFTAPETMIVSGPDNNQPQESATFVFSSNETGVTFECRVDGGPYVACSNPVTYAGLSKGDHTLHVRARDRAGNVDATPAVREWKSK